MTTVVDHDLDLARIVHDLLQNRRVGLTSLVRSDAILVNE
jgi:hypothetical protein